MAEIGLGRVFGIWHEPAEVYPYAIFRRLAGGGRLPPKRTRVGRAMRCDLLDGPGVTGTDAVGRSHDLLDATAAALAALHRSRGTATTATCGHDGTAIWLPSPAAVAEPAEPAFGR